MDCYRSLKDNPVRLLRIFQDAMRITAGDMLQEGWQGPKEAIGGHTLYTWAHQANASSAPLGATPLMACSKSLQLFDLCMRFICSHQSWRLSSSWIPCQPNDKWSASLNANAVN